MIDDITTLAWAYLSRVAEPPCDEIAALVGEVGPVEASHRVAAGEVSDALRERTAARRDIHAAEADLNLLERRGGRLITPDSDEWPTLAFAAFGGAAVRERPQGRPPLALWAIGPARLDEVAERSAAIVGTRACSSLGLRIVTRNWRCRYGELDIIAATGDRTVVFVEVKTRTGDGFGGVQYAVTPAKVRRIRRLAGIWLAGQDQRWAAVRIDVIGVRIGRQRTPEISHLRGVG